AGLRRPGAAALAWTGIRAGAVHRRRLHARGVRRSLGPAQPWYDGCRAAALAADRFLRPPCRQSAASAGRDDGHASRGMRLRVQVVIEPDDDEPNGDRPSAVVRDVASIERCELTVDALGITLA